MTNRNPSVTKEPQLDDCICFRLRRAGRISAKLYDKTLKPSGLRNTQFTLIASINQFEEISIGDLAKELATDGTTLTRNLEVLIRRGLIENIKTEDARVRKVHLTELGKQKFIEALPLWQKAQKHVLTAIDPEPWSGIGAQLNRIEVACKG